MFIGIDLYVHNLVLDVHRAHLPHHMDVSTVNLLICIIFMIYQLIIMEIDIGNIIISAYYEFSLPSKDRVPHLEKEARFAFFFFYYFASRRQSLQHYD